MATRIIASHTWDWTAENGRRRFQFWNRDPQGREFVSDYQTPGWRRVSVQTIHSGVTGQVVQRIIKRRHDLHFREMAREGMACQ